MVADGHYLGPHSDHRAESPGARSFGIAHIAARTPPHGSSGVTGESEPNANATPTPCNAPSGVVANARLREVAIERADTAGIALRIERKVTCLYQQR